MIKLQYPSKYKGRWKSKSLSQILISYEYYDPNVFQEIKEVTGIPISIIYKTAKKLIDTGYLKINPDLTAENIN